MAALRQTTEEWEADFFTPAPLRSPAKAGNIHPNIYLDTNGRWYREGSGGEILWPTTLGTPTNAVVAREDKLERLRQAHFGALWAGAGVGVDGPRPGHSGDCPYCKNNFGRMADEVNRMFNVPKIGPPPRRLAPGEEPEDPHDATIFRELAELCGSPVAAANLAEAKRGDPAKAVRACRANEPEGSIGATMTNATCGLTMFRPERLYIGGAPTYTTAANGKRVVSNWIHPQEGRRTNETPESFTQWVSRPVVSESKEAPGAFCLAHFKDDVRLKAGVESVFGIGLDCDDGSATIERAARLLANYWFVAYSTHSHTPDAPRWRGILLFSRPATGDEYPFLWEQTDAWLKRCNLKLDPATKDASRLWYVPAVRPGAQFEYHHHEGRRIDVDAMLAAARKRAEAEARARQEAARRRPSVASTSGDIVERVRRYVAKMPIAIEGAGGSRDAFNVACQIVADIPDHATQFALFEEYSARCQPPWSEKEIEHKLADARKLSRKTPLTSRGR